MFPKETLQDVVYCLLCGPMHTKIPCPPSIVLVVGIIIRSLAVEGRGGLNSEPLQRYQGNSSSFLVLTYWLPACFGIFQDSKKLPCWYPTIIRNINGCR